MNGIGIRKLAALAATAGAMLSGIPAQAQSQAPISVTVMVIDDYPAFQPPEKQRDPRAREVRALVRRHDPTGKDGIVIILNPAHFDAQTLSDALQAVTGPPSGQTGRMRSDGVALAVPRRGSAADPQTLAALSAILDDLRARPTVDLSRLGGFGRSIVLSDIWPYLSRKQ